MFHRVIVSFVITVFVFYVVCTAGLCCVSCRSLHCDVFIVVLSWFNTSRPASDFLSCDCSRCFYHLWSTDVDSCITRLTSILLCHNKTTLRGVYLSCFRSVCSPRLVLHHDLAFPVEGVRHHFGQLSSSLHNQIPEAQVFTSELLQTIVVSQTWITRVCFVVSCFFELSIFCTFFTHWSSVTDRWPVEVEEPLEQWEMEKN